MIIAALFTLLTIYQDDHAVVTSGMASRSICSEARSQQLYGISVADKAKKDAEARRYAESVAAWRKTRPCRMIDRITFDSPAHSNPRRYMTCTVPGGNGERTYSRPADDSEPWDIFFDEFGGPKYWHDDPATTVKSATCLREDDR